MKILDEIIKKYKKLSQNETHFLETVEDLEYLKKHLNKHNDLTKTKKKLTWNDFLTLCNKQL
jgi:hypothetical protein